MTSRAELVRRERDRKRLADAWAAFDDATRKLRSALSEIEFAPRDLDAIGALGAEGRYAWACADAVTKLSRKVGA